VTNTLVSSHPGREARKIRDDGADDVGIKTRSGTRFQDGVEWRETSPGVAPETELRRENGDEDRLDVGEWRRASCLLGRGAFAVVKEHEVFTRSEPEPRFELIGALGIGTRLVRLSGNGAPPIRALPDGTIRRTFGEGQTGVHVVVDVHGKNCNTPSFRGAGMLSSRWSV